ncbi:NAD-P-binding protein [Mycena rosella]|uniref:NAD-P-binding protein n=1 Tax=Mycena rosella TaxID=1033263 RepID=A0AAD7G5C1_MYCRO|nr:NAD-P-binding protein [Mycena rosella]
MTLPTFSFTTTAEEVASTFSEQIRGKNVLITGTSLNGIGFEAARVIAKYANLVVMTGYSAERLKLSEEAMKKELPSANIRPLVLDLSSLAAVRTAAAEVNAYAEPIHILINNAAAAGGPFELSVDGLELQMATDHVGPFLLTKLIAPKLLAAATATFTPRVVFVASSAHAFGTGVDLSTVAHPDPAKYDPMGAYSQAKSANILTAIEFSKRSRGKINAYSLHPGTIVTNMMQKPATRADLQAIGFLGADGQPSTDKVQWKTIPQGAATTVAAAFDTRIEDKPGAYLDDGTEANAKLAAHCADPGNAEKLWKITEQIIGEPFTF